MRILLLSLRVPYPPNNGAKMRNWALLRGLAAEGHEITLLTFMDREDDGAPRAEISELCRGGILRVPHEFKSLSSSRGYFGRAMQLASSLPFGVAAARSDEIKRRISEVLADKSIELIFCEETDLLVNLPPISAPLIVDFHNVDHLILERYAEYERNPAKKTYALFEARRVRRWEAFACRAAAAALTCSDHDGSLLRSHRRGLPMFTVPNAIDTAEYRPGGDEHPRKILFQGGMDWFPNRDGVEFFSSAIFPLIRAEIPDARFVVAGRNPSEEFKRRICETAGIEFTGTVPDMRAEIATGAVSVIPLRIGSGTRLKILEAGAMGKAMVSTRLGAEGLDFEDGKEIRIADDPKDFAAAVVSFLRNPADRKRFGEAACKRVEQSYSLTAVRAALARALGSIQPEHKRNADALSERDALHGVS